MAKTLVLILCLLPATVFGFAPKSFSFKFSQIEKNYTGKVTENSGILDFESPKNLKIQLTSPIDELIVVNSENMLKFSPSLDSKEPPSLAKSKNTNHPMLSFLNSLTKGLSNNPFFIAEYSANKIVLKIKPEHQEALGATTFVLVGKTKLSSSSTLNDISEIILTKLNKLTNQYKILDFNQKVFPAKYFEFTLPAKTKITNIE